MILQKILPSLTSTSTVYLLGSAALFSRDADDAELKTVWSFPEDSKATLLPVCAVSEEFAILADSSKQVYLVRLADGSIVSQQRSEKCPTAVLFEKVEDASVTALIADRFGDVSRTVFSLSDSTVESTIIVGHVSIITDMAVANGLLLTADRDEKVRLTILETPHIIKAFLLGHTEYITAIGIVNGDRVVSVAGDGTVRLWRLDADGSDMSANQIDCFKLDAEKYGRKVKVERVVEKKETDECVEEEIEEVEQYLVEPMGLTVNKSTVAIYFDKLNIFCLLNVEEDRLIASEETVALPEGHQIISACYLNNKLDALSIKDSTFYLTSAACAEPVELGSNEAASGVIDGLWKGGMRKDCHGLFAKRMKSKRAKEDAADAELSDIDDE